MSLGQKILGTIFLEFVMALLGLLAGQLLGFLVAGAVIAGVLFLLWFPGVRSRVPIAREFELEFRLRAQPRIEMTETLQGVPAEDHTGEEPRHVCVLVFEARTDGGRAPRIARRVRATVFFRDISGDGPPNYVLDEAQWVEVDGNRNPVWHRHSSETNIPGIGVKRYLAVAKKARTGRFAFAWTPGRRELDVARLPPGSHQV